MHACTDHWQLLGLIERATDTIKGEPLCESCAATRRTDADRARLLATA